MPAPKATKRTEIRVTARMWRAVEGQGEGDHQEDKLDKDVSGHVGLKGEPLGDVGKVGVGQGQAGRDLEDQGRDADALEFGLEGLDDRGVPLSHCLREKADGQYQVATGPDRGSEEVDDEG
jgi:hypothetical protein